MGRVRSRRPGRVNLGAAVLVALAAALLPGAARAQEVPGAPEAVRRFGPEGAGESLRLRTTTDIAILAPVIEAFLAERPGLELVYEQWGSNDLYAISAAECAAGRPMAGLVISSAVHQLVKLVNDGCAVPRLVPGAAALPDALSWRDEIWGISREPAVMVYNRALVPEADVPRSRFDLLDLLRREDTPYAGRVATYDIEASGLGFLFAFMDAQEATTFGALMEAFARTGAVATCCSAEIIRGVQRGEYLVAYNVLGSYARTRAVEDPDLGIVAPSDYTLVLSRAAILPGARRGAAVGGPRGAGRAGGEAAGALLDFLLSQQGQLLLTRTRLAGPVSAGLTEEEAGARQVPIGLGPPLLLAMDRARVRQFVARWRAAFGPVAP